MEPAWLGLQSFASCRVDCSFDVLGRIVTDVCVGASKYPVKGPPSLSCEKSREKAGRGEGLELDVR